MRRMQMENSTNQRFNDYYNLLWQNPGGIDPAERLKLDDDASSFGVYRVWSDVNLDWGFKMKPGVRCPTDSVWIDMVDFKDSTDISQLERNCRQWCEQLIR